MAPPVAGYTSWWDASNTGTVTTSGGNVTQITDQGSAARNLTPAVTGPAWGSRTVNSLKVLDYPGGSDRRLQTGTYTMAQPMTYFVVVVSDIAANSSSINAQIIRDNTGNQPSILVYSTGAASRKWATYAGTVQQSSTAMDNSVHVLAVVFNGSSSGLWLDGTSVNTGNPGSNGLSGARFTVGDTGTFDGAIGEVIVYASALNTTDRQSVESYLTTKWTVPAAATITAAATLPALTSAGSLEPSDALTAVATLPALTASATIAPSDVLTAAATLPALTGAATLEPAAAVTADATLPALVGAATLAPATGMTGDATLPALTAAVSLGRIPAPRGRVTLAGTTARGGPTLSGTTSRGRITASGTTSRGPITAEV